jgi:hypothetical protein
MSKEVELLKKLIARASDRASSENEKQAALKRATGIVSELSATDCAQETEEYIAQLEAEREGFLRSSRKTYEIIRDLERDVATYKLRAERAEKTLRAAEKRLNSLGEQTEQPNVRLGRNGSTKATETATNGSNQNGNDFEAHRCETGYLHYEDLAARAHAIFGRAHWRGALAYHLGISIKVMSAWKTVDLVPASFVAELERMTEVERQPASRQPWTPDEHQALKALINARQTNLEAARILSARFGRRLYESSIAGQRRRLGREGWSVERRPGHTGAPPLARRAAGRASRDHAVTERASG